MLENSTRRPKKQPSDVPPMAKVLEDLCSQHGVSVDQLDAYLTDPEQFDPQVWESMQAFKQKLADELACVLDNISNPEETKSKYKELEQARQWIFVR
jgi:hypothetical protein